MNAEEELIQRDILAFLSKHENKELLRFVIVGSVDDGKSTLIGRLLFELQAVYEDQLEAVRKATTMVGVPIDYSLITDGLEAEREQGITIDVAYRYFTTERRKFIVADTPGHVQYTRNMVTGASTADVCVILLDARLGVLEQSRRHAYIASLLGIPHLLVAINKMDLAGYARERYEQLVGEFTAFCRDLSFKDVTFVPVSALLGENVVQPGASMPWYGGPTVLGYLENVPIAGDMNLRDLRLPVQYVLRPHLNYRGFAGQLASGTVRTGDEVVILPSGKSSRVRAIDTYQGELDVAFAPQSITVRLEDEIDCSRGDMIAAPDHRPRCGRHLRAQVVWLHEQALDPQRQYLLKHLNRVVRMQVAEVHWKLDLEQLSPVPSSTLQVNEIGLLSIECHRELVYDTYRENRRTGAFVIIDASSFATVGGGMIVAPPGGDGSNRQPPGSNARVTEDERRRRLGQHGVAVLIAGSAALEVTELAYAVEAKLFDLGHIAHVIVAEAESLDVLVHSVKACADAGVITICVAPGIGSSLKSLLETAVGASRFCAIQLPAEACEPRSHHMDEIIACVVKSQRSPAIPG